MRVVYGWDSGRIMFCSRTSAGWRPSARATSSTARSPMSVAWVCPNPRYAPVGMVLVATRRPLPRTASHRYGPGAMPSATNSGPPENTLQCAPALRTMSTRRPRSVPSSSKATSRSHISLRAWVVASIASLRLSVHSTGHPASSAAMITINSSS